MLFFVVLVHVVVLLVVAMVGHISVLLLVSVVVIVSPLCTLTFVHPSTMNPSVNCSWHCLVRLSKGQATRGPDPGHL